MFKKYETIKKQYDGEIYLPTALSVLHNVFMQIIKMGEDGRVLSGIEYDDKTFQMKLRFTDARIKMQ